MKNDNTSPVRLALRSKRVAASLHSVAAPILIFCAVAASSSPGTCAAEPARSDQPAATQTPTLRLADLHLWEPAWNSDVVYLESSILLQADESSAATARLAYPAAEILQVKTASGEVTLKQGKDYVLEDDGTRLRFSKNAAITPIAESELFRAPDSPHSYRHRAGHPEQSLLYAPGRWFHDRNIEVTYRRKRPTVAASASAVSATPADSPVANSHKSDATVVASHGALKRTQKLLADGSPLRIVLIGDSISTGLDASGLSAAAPNQPGYADLLVAQLRDTFGSNITLHNVAVSGTSIASGIPALDALRADPQTLTSPPQLLIVAFGMNDVGRRDSAWFGDQARQILAHAITVWPEIDVLFVSSMLGNPEWVHTPIEMFPAYALELQTLTSDRVALADVTAVWTDVIRNKHPLDITGNGLNHPNDFGHRLYAQTVLSCFQRKRTK